MNSIKTGILNSNELKALNELKIEINSRFINSEIILFGSKARKESTVYSDIDLLILIEQEPDIKLKEEIMNQCYEIELKYDIITNPIIRDKSIKNKTAWHNLPFYANIDKDGFRV